MTDEDRTCPSCGAIIPRRMAFPGLFIDRDARTVQVDGQARFLTAKEFDLLDYLAAHHQSSFTKGELLERVWGYEYGSTGTVVEHVRRLRLAIGAHWIETLRGYGYKFDPRPA